MPQITEKKSGWILLGIILFALLLRLFYYNGWAGSDDAIYYKLARNIAHGEPIEEPHWYLSRIVSIAIVSLFLEIFGDKVFFAILPNIVFSIANIIMVYILTNYLFSWREALVAAGIMAILPLDVVYSTTMVPDIQCAFFLIAAILFFHKGIDQEFGVRPILQFTLSGLFITMAFFSKQTGILIFGSLFFYTVFSSRMSRSSLIALGITSLSFVVLSASIFLGSKVLLGDVVHNSHIKASIKPIGLDYGYFEIARIMAFHLISYLRIIFSPFNPFGLFGVLFAVASVFCLIREKRCQLLFFWSAFLFLYTVFGSQNLSVYWPIPIQPRYLLPLIPPLVIMLAVFYIRVASLSDALKTASIGLTLVILGHSLYHPNNFSGKLFFTGTGNAMVEAIRMIPVASHEPIYVSEWSWVRFQAIFDNNEKVWIQSLGSISDMEIPNIEGMLKGSYIIIARRELEEGQQRPLPGRPFPPGLPADLAKRLITTSHTTIEVSPPEDRIGQLLGKLGFKKDINFLEREAVSVYYILE